MNNKKAVSDVVSTVLIILLVVAAVAIIGAIILNTVNKGGSSVNSAVACNDIDIHPTKCTLNTPSGSSTAVAERGADNSGATVTALTFIFSKSDGTTITAAATTLPTSVGVTATGIASGVAFTSVKTAATIKLSDGTTATCNPSTTVVDCA